MSTPQQKYETMVATLSEQIMDKLKLSAHEAYTTPATLLSAVVARLVGEDARSDGREREWRARRMLFDYRNMSEPVGDSDYGVPYGSPGETIIRGLPNVLEWISELASHYHNAPCFGLEKHVLLRKLAGLRVQMANRGDNTCTLRVNYSVEGWPEPRRMFLRCDIERMGRDDPMPTRPQPWSKYYK